MKLSRSKIIFIASDVLIAVYLLLAFSSFDKKGENRTLCNKVNIDIADNATNGFIDAKIIKDRLQKSGIYPIGREMCNVNTRSIEDMLARSPFVQTAECYKTVGGHVYISVTQRMPVIRIKADNGCDYYVDDNDRVMPSTRYTSDLIIATGRIDRWYATRFLSPLGRVIMTNDMWKNLIEQINVLPDHSIEIVPRTGDHIVHLGRLPDGKGRADHLEAIQKFMTLKMTRLAKFYKYGLSVVGWNKYSYIDLEFDNQIICRRKSAHHTETPVEPTPVATANQQPQDETIEAAPTQAEPNNDSAAKQSEGKEKKSDRTDKAKSERTEKPKSERTEKLKSERTEKSKSDRTEKSKSDRTAKSKSDHTAKAKSDHTGKKKA